MKKLWNAVSVLAVANLLALLLFAGWLWLSGRVDADRISQIRALLAMTIEEAAEVEAELAALAEQEADAADARARRENPPLSSAAQVRQAKLIGDNTGQAVRRLQDETDQLLAQLNRREAQLTQREQEFEAGRARWLAGIEEERRRRADEQLRKTVKQYESAPPAIARQWILELVNDGRKDQVVAYLDAMNARAASKILREFKTEEESALATELLEKLRTFGTAAEAIEDSSDDDGLASADQPADR